MLHRAALALALAALACAALAQPPDDAVAAADAAAASGDAFAISAALPSVTVTILKPGGAAVHQLTIPVAQETESAVGQSLEWASSAAPATSPAARTGSAGPARVWPATVLGRRSLSQAGRGVNTVTTASVAVPRTYAPEAAPGSPRARAEAKLQAFHQGTLPAPLMEANPPKVVVTDYAVGDLAEDARQGDGSTLAPGELSAHRGDVPRPEGRASGGQDADADVRPDTRVDVVPAIVSDGPAPPPAAAAAAAEVGVDALRLSASPAQAVLADPGAGVLGQYVVSPPKAVAPATAAGAGAAASGTSVCSGGGRLVVVAGTAVSVHDAKSGALLAGPTPLTAFFKDAGGGRYSGGRCVYDGPGAPGARQFYVAALRRPAAGKRGTAARLVVAATTDGDPTGAWAGPFSVDADGLERVGDADAEGAPLPGLGACKASGCDARSLALGLDGVSLWAAMELWTPGNASFTGALALGLPKAFLRAGQPGSPPAAALTSFPLWARALTPSTTEASAMHDSSAGGTEYLVAAGDGALAVWAVTGTTNGGAGWAVKPSVSTPVLLPSRAANDPDRLFSAGVPRPATGLPGAPLAVDVVAPRRISQVSLANSHLWLATPAAVLNGGDLPVLGVAYFVLRPEVSETGGLSVVVDDTGIVSVDGAALAAPTATGSASQTGLLTFVMVGPQREPTLAYATFSSTAGPSDVRPLVSPAMPAAKAALPPPMADNDPLDAVTLGHWTSAVAQDDSSFWVAGRYAACAPGDDAGGDAGSESAACRPGYATAAALVTVAPSSS